MLVRALSGGGSGNEKYDTIPYSTLAANTKPTFTTKGRAKAIWMSYTITNQTARTILRSNVNPSTGEVSDDTIYVEDTANGHSTASASFTISDNSVLFDYVLSSQAAGYITLAYTYE